MLEPNYHQFHQLQKQSAREREFLDLHTKDWLHGPGNIHTVILYTPSRLARENGSASAMEEIIFLPRVSMDPVAPQRLCTRLSSLTLGLSDGFVSLHILDFKRTHEASPFSGLCSIPRFLMGLQRNAPPSEIMRQYCYQAHFELGEIAYVFGGLRTDVGASLKRLGIPRATDLARISVHLAGDLPPYVNKEVLMSPLLTPNPSIFIFNPTRGTIQELLGSSFSDLFPGHLLQPEGTQVSPHEVFWCGGFEAKVVSVTYNDDLDRWIVRKKIVPNVHGYVMNTRSLLFSKISIRSKLLMRYTGRLGSCVVSNMLAGPAKVPFFAHAPDHKHDKSDHKHDKSDHKHDHNKPPSVVLASKEVLEPEARRLELDLQKHPRDPSSDSHRLDCRDRSSGTPDTELASISSRATSKAPASDPVSRKNTVANISERSAATDARPTVNIRGKPNLAPASVHTKASEPSLSASSVRAKIGESLAKVGLSPPPAPSSLKVTNMLHKSTRIFHRDRGTLSKSGSALIQLPSLNLYSRHVKTHRTAMLLQANRPSSPPTCKPLHSRPSRTPSGASDATGSGFDVSSSASSMASLTAGPTMAPPTPRLLTPDNTVKTAEKDTLKPETTAAEAVVDGNSVLKPEVASVTVYQFGGFKYTPDENGKPHCTATNELLKIELLHNDKKFHSEALLLKVSPGEGEIWPSPRGYFASVLINSNTSGEDTLAHRDGEDVESPRSSKLSFDLSSDQSSSISPHSFNGDDFFERKSLVIHGGVNCHYNVFSDLYTYSFATGKWETIQTYAFDYFEVPKQPFEDEDSSKLSFENQVKSPQLVEAELRSCHHRAYVHSQDGTDNVFFIGGFQNDYLRHFDKTPYYNDKFDVSRLFRLLLSMTNPNLLRLPILNMTTQRWRFDRFFYDLSEVISPQAMESLMGNDFMQNSRASIHGGACSFVGKLITLCQGLVEFVTEKKNDQEKMLNELQVSTIMFGGHAHLSFPSL